MKQFTYKALDKDGKSFSGTIEALGEKQAARVLQERGLTVVFLREKADFQKKILAFLKFDNRVSARSVAVFTRLLATMLSTGLPLVDALSNLSLQESGYFREVIRSIQNDVQSGVSLSESMSRFPEVFTSLYVNLVKAGEASGKVSEVLNKLADTLEADLDFKAKVKGALMYPAIICSAMGGIGIFMMTTIIPQIASVYRDFNADLPLPTKIMIGLSLALKNYFVVFLFVLGLLFVGYKILRRNPVSDALINNFSYRVPIFGPLSSDVALAILNRTLGTLLGSGVAIIDALKIVSSTMGNDYYRSGIEGATRSVEKGMPLSQTIRHNPVFPLMMAQLTAIGEETGTLDQSLMRLAQFYEGSAERSVKTVTTAIEPIMILIMGVAVGGLAISVLLPMFNLVNVVNR